MNKQFKKLTGIYLKSWDKLELHNNKNVLAQLK